MRVSGLGGSALRVDGALGFTFLKTGGPEETLRM